MSRIGRLPVAIPPQVTVGVQAGVLSVGGPRGTLRLSVHPAIAVEVREGSVVCTRRSDTKTHKALHGLTRSLLANMVVGVTQGFQKKLELVGVGYRAAVQGQQLTLTLGCSHPIIYPIPPTIGVTVENQTAVTVSGPDKQLVGQVAAKLRSLRPPEPYKGKGVKYSDERIRRKAGKTGA